MASPPDTAASQPTMAPVVQPAAPTLQGHWNIIAVNGRPVSGAWLTLGGEGETMVTRNGSSIYVKAPQPPTSALLGCNWWHPNGWTRDGARLILGTEMSVRTERGCDPATEALEEEIYAILSRPAGLDLKSEDRLRLTNTYGSVELFRDRATQN